MRIALIALLLVGCSRSFTELHYKKASELCLSNGGFDSASIGDTGNMNVYCKNGAMFYNVEPK